MSRGINRQHRTLKAPSCNLQIWTIDDEDKLGEEIAYLVLGQWKQVEKLLNKADPLRAVTSINMLTSAIGSLTTEKTECDVHLDGWIFQFISWLVAAPQKNSRIRAPQMQKASKGFDGVQIIFNTEHTAVEKFIIFEDKATTDPRGKIQSQVWKEFEDLEQGNRDNELNSDVTAILDGVSQISDDDLISIVDELFRDSERRCYRVSVTGQNRHQSDVELTKLLNGFDATVLGKTDRRLANVLITQDVRQTLKRIISKAIDILESELHSLESRQDV